MVLFTKTEPTPGVSTSRTPLCRKGEGKETSTWATRLTLFGLARSVMNSALVATSISVPYSCRQYLLQSVPSTYWTVAEGSGPYRTIVTIEVKGITAVGSTSAPSSALIRLDLPRLNCPSTTRLN